MAQRRATMRRSDGAAFVRAQSLEEVLKLPDLWLRPPLERLREHVDRGPLDLSEALPGFRGQLDVDDATVLLAPSPGHQTGPLELVDESRDVAGRDAQGLREFLRGGPPFVDQDPQEDHLAEGHALLRERRSHTA